MAENLLTATIITYNHHASIAQCIESIVNQKTDYPYEIHLCDDCSIDGTTEICREYAEKYPDKIKFFPQAKNTYLNPYDKTHVYEEIQRISTKYFCIIDGDDHWCNENKVQIALDFLENNPEYSGWAHDTLMLNKFGGTSTSHIHDDQKYDITSGPVTFAAMAPFFLTSSRIFRNMGFREKRICPIDFLVYYYHFQKAPIYYHDEIMAVYTIDGSSTFANLTLTDQADYCSMFAHKMALFFNFKEDEFCMEMQKKYDDHHWKMGTKRHDRLRLFKKIFGIRLGWTLWFFFTFVPKYGLESMNINYVYSREKIKESTDNRVKCLLGLE